MMTSDPLGDGLRQREHPLMIGKQWGDQAEEMAEIADELLDEQDLSTADTTAQLHLQSIRQTGYECRDFLESECEDDNGDPLPMEDRPNLGGMGDREEAIEETHDLAPLCWQLLWALQEVDHDD